MLDKILNDQLKQEIPIDYDINKYLNYIRIFNIKLEIEIIANLINNFSFNKINVIIIDLIDTSDFIYLIDILKDRENLNKNMIKLNFEWILKEKQIDLKLLQNIIKQINFYLEIKIKSELESKNNNLFENNKSNDKLFITKKISKASLFELDKPSVVEADKKLNGNIIDQVKSEETNDVTICDNNKDLVKSDNNINEFFQFVKFKKVKNVQDSKLTKIRILNDKARKCMIVDMPTLIEKLNQGKLISFPTETVYGIGCDITQRKTIESIFKTKNRPKTDPLIVHINNFNHIMKYLDLSNEELKVLKIISDKLMPGPLTIILKVRDSFPNVDLVSAKTGQVAFRIPNHHIAQELILSSKSGMIPAPSANKFMHVSPVHQKHVVDDFYYDKVQILKHSEYTAQGIESTIIKMQNEEIIIMREGSFQNTNLIINEFPEFKISYNNKTNKIVAPGMFKKHQSPQKPCQLVENKENKIENEISIDEIGVISIFKNENIKSKAYKQLQTDKDIISIFKNQQLFLREFEKMDIKLIALWDNSDKTIQDNSNNDINKIIKILRDKLIKSSSGKTCQIKNEKLFQ